MRSWQIIAGEMCTLQVKERNYIIKLACFGSGREEIKKRENEELIQSIFTGQRVTERSALQRTKTTWIQIRLPIIKLLVVSHRLQE